MKMREQIEQYLQVLCNEIGTRPTGSEANQKAVDYVSEEFEKCGCQVQRQKFDCMDWTHRECSLMVDGKEVSIFPAPYSLACDVQGKIVCVNSLDELRRTEITEKIVLLCGELASEPLMPKSFVFWNPDEHKETISLLENGKPLAVLTVSLSVEKYIPVIEDGDFEIACGIVLPESVNLLHNGADAILQINTERKAATAENVIATIGKGERKICFSAHIDTKEGTPGALDNASGVTVLLALADKLSDLELAYRVEFVLFNGEDYYSNPGEMTYMASYLSKPEDYVYAYNIDGVGVKNQKISYSLYECPKEFVSSIAKAAKEFQDIEEIEPWPQGDHTLFAVSGVPAVAITSSGIFGLVDEVLHTKSDTLEWIDTTKIEMVVDFLCRSIEVK
ncbi:MAG: M28 family peptidase [Clostridia bacterium]|nr:M28 family peptidase [Clostridia bacterium]